MGEEGGHIGISASKWSRQLQGVGVPIAPAISMERPRVIREESKQRL